MLCEGDYCIRFVDMPCKLKAYTVEYDGFYNIYVNSKISFEQGGKSIQHELEHIANGDFEKEESADAIENSAHDTQKTKTTPLFFLN